MLRASELSTANTTTIGPLGLVFSGSPHNFYAQRSQTLNLMHKQPCPPTFNLDIRAPSRMNLQLKLGYLGLK